ncbi:MAG: Serine/threonine-protein kinase tel1 [Claussenomyces sp. TS43310]|nr:MAG: Serine/threonine-protein kinase tel1 [Claussenomyces sp. TS43310]
MGPSNSDITIKDTLDLKVIFDHNYKSLTIATLKDGAYHKIFEALFQIAAAEKQAYLSAKSTIRKSKAEAILSSCSDALRLVIRAGTKKLKPKTVKAIIEHVTQLLPGVLDGEYCAALNDTYLKVLIVVLENEAHIENLQLSDWLSTLDFCNRGIAKFYNHSVVAEASLPSHVSSDPSASVYSAQMATSTSSPSQAPSRRKPANSVTKKNVGELLECLLSLVSASNAPILDRAEDICRSVLLFLKSQNTVTRLHQVALSALNFVLSAIVMDRLSLSQAVARDLLSIIARLWSLRDVAKDEMLNSVRDEMLIALISVDVHLARLVADDLDGELQPSIESLENILQSEYGKRLSRDQLQLDDMDMGAPWRQRSRDPGSMPIGTLLIKDHSPRAERNWALLHVLRVLNGLLDTRARSGRINGDVEQSDDGKHPRKRRRIAHRVGSLVERLEIDDEGDRLCALQTLLFFLPDCKLSGWELDNLLVSLSLCVTDKRNSIASWSILCIATCTLQPAARSESCAFDWVGNWHTIARLVTNPNTCRAASYLLHSVLAVQLVLYQDISDDVDAMLTTTVVSAPTILCDASLSLMMHLLHLRSLEVPNGSSITSHHVIRWLSAKWNPTDKSFASRCAIDAYAIDILNVLRVCLGSTQIQLSQSRNHVCGAIGQAWLQRCRRRQNLHYLLLIPDSTSTVASCSGCPSACLLYQHDLSPGPFASLISAQRLTVDGFLPGFESLLQDWRSNLAQQPSQISFDAMKCAVSTCIFGHLLLAVACNSSIHQLDTLQDILKLLSDLVLAALSPGEHAQTLREAALQAVEPYLPQSSPSELHHLANESPQLLQFLAGMAEMMKQDRSIALQPELMDIDDPADIEGMFGPQRGHARLEASRKLSLREDNATASSSLTFNIVTIARLTLISLLSSSAAGNTESLISAFLDQILQLPDDQLLLCRSLFKEILQAGFNIDPTSTNSLIRRMGSIVGNSEFDTSEVALGLCLDVMSGLVNSWACIEGVDAKDAAMDLYEWFINVVIPKRRPSPYVQRELSALLFELMRLRFNPGDWRALPSVRSSLLDILHGGALIVKFHIGNRLSDIFKLFILNLHDTVLTDVLESLPSEPEWAEGIAFRLYVLGKLASKWPTLLRPCTYYILEVPGSLPEATSHATRCIADISATLCLKSSRDLFQLFSSQLLYTWLESETVEKLPYKIFGYASLRDLIEDCTAEIVALMTMRNQDERVSNLAQMFNIPIDQLLQASFAKTMAYSISHDISVPPSMNSKYVSGEKRLRIRLGNELFYELVNQHFADILALFFNIIDQDDNVEKSFIKDPTMISVVHIINDIKSFSTSPALLPPNQQPAFKAKYLPSQIEHLCGRTEYEASKLYTASMTTFIARSLLNTIHPALGSLHACSVLRKLRLLIAFSGKVALEGYPIEMLLHSIRPYMTDPECADDAIGLARYLFANGFQYLATTPSFIAGISLSIFASLKALLVSSPASTIPEIQHQATLPKAQRFHSWLGSYLDGYPTKVLSGETRRAFRAIIQSARETRAVGNAEHGTAESELLMEIFEDQQSGRQLLSKQSRDLAFSLLYTEFKSPRSFRDDILGGDEKCVDFANSIWTLCRSNHAQGQFLVWAAKVLGRAFASTGHVHKQFSNESELDGILGLAKSSAAHEISTTSILRLLQALTRKDHARTAGLAEVVLRVIIANLDETVHPSDIAVYEQTLTQPLFKASLWAPYRVPPSDISYSQIPSPHDPFAPDAINEPHWLQNLMISLAKSVPSDIMLPFLPCLLKAAKEFAEHAFPFVLHLVLSFHLDGSQGPKRQISKALKVWLGAENDEVKGHLKLLINALLYLRTQSIPREISSADRIQWLDIDYTQVSEAAARCGMVKTALLFLEISFSEIGRSASRRSSLSTRMEPTELLLTIFKNVDDPDMFYGLQQDPNISNILARLEYENDGLKGLAFRSAHFDSSLRRQDGGASRDAQALVDTLGKLSLDGLSHSLSQSQQAYMARKDGKSIFHTARKLEQWDLPVPSTNVDDAATIYKTFQAVRNATNRDSIHDALASGLKSTMSSLANTRAGAHAIRTSLQTLAVFAEMDEVLSTCGSEHFQETLSRFQARSLWMKTGNQQSRLREIINVTSTDARLVEVQTTLLSSSLNRSHSALQESLTSATYLTDLIEPCRTLGLNIEAVVQIEVAQALWDQGEMASSIGLLQSIDKKTTLKKQTLPIGRPHLLTNLGYQVSSARLEKPDRIIEHYLMPALRELRGQVHGSEAGHVFHEFAVFCDRQLQDPDNIEDLDRLRKLKETKESEVHDLGRMVKKAGSSDQKAKYHSAYRKAQQWLQLDNDEYRRQVISRDNLLRESLGNFLLSLTASDDHNNDALRFSALWLEHSEEEIASEVVSKHLNDVPSYKFVSLMNQLTSRLLDHASSFQKLLFSLVLRICVDHPYHGMYQIWAGSRSKSNASDETAVSRINATIKVGQRLANQTQSATAWSAINNVSKMYCQLAAERDESRYKSGQKISLKNSSAGTQLNSLLSKYSIPPPTMHIEISTDLDYSQVPFMYQLDAQITIASGVSAPKIITAIASDGAKYKQLVKGGNDDLRQDAIMEQVFAQVSELLRTNTSTRQRNLGIRTYKVLPLSAHAGIIEFVPNTIPLHDYLMPAHVRYYPKDLSSQQCRKQIGDVMTQKLEIRVKAYRAVAEKFHPVMRYFFMEKFHDPDDWFAKRLAYTRSTAAISILGHVLGLGDRHGHNILLDETTGEVVHIDLGVAFEMGRVLPVPELVPFRLTRDIVDGMGMTKTEGVYRRCCEFTLEALRKESYSIMAILDVLRYDPLYSWSISPIRLAKLQNAQSAAPPVNSTVEASEARLKSKEAVNEPSEADRALTIVNKKLSKALSVTAIVNDLINQATDERNLAVLYSGMHPYTCKIKKGTDIR